MNEVWMFPVTSYGTLMFSLYKQTHISGHFIQTYLWSFYSLHVEAVSQSLDGVLKKTKTLLIYYDWAASSARCLHRYT